MATLVLFQTKLNLNNSNYLLVLARQGTRFSIAELTMFDGCICFPLSEL
jgi:hypothetical protein